MNPAQGTRRARGGDLSFLRVPRVLCGEVLFLALTLLGAHPAYAADEAKLDALRGRIETLKKDLTGAEENRSEASDELRASERGVSEANRILRNIGAQQGAARADLARVGEQSRKLEAAIAAQQRELGQLLAMRHASGQQDYLRLLLSGRDPNQTARELYYYSYLSRAQADFIRALRTNLVGLAQLAREARDKSAELAELEARQREGRKELLAQQAERRRVLSRLATQIRSQRREIKSLQRDEARLSRLVEELGKIVSPRTSGRRNEKLPESGGEGGAFASLKGKLRLPATPCASSRRRFAPDSSREARPSYDSRGLPRRQRPRRWWLPFPALRGAPLAAPGALRRPAAMPCPRRRAGGLRARQS